MGEEMTRSAGKYWILYFQPLPEAGERIAMALVFEGREKHATVEYDPAFAKVSQLFPDADPEGLAFCLDTLRAELRATESIEATLGLYGPQFAVSDARRLALPVADATVTMLKARYLYPAKRGRKERAKEDKVAQGIQAYIRGLTDSRVEFRTNVNARDIFGHAVPGTKRVALALETPTGWTLVDGVDLNLLSAEDAAARADDIARTFWNYGRADLGKSLQRVGVVLNGHSHLDPKTNEVHDYALHRFETDSDHAIDSAASGSDSKLRRLLEPATP